VGAWELLRSQGLGLICAGATIALLAAGSVILAATRDGASAGVRLDDLRVFFLQPSPWHVWLYLLIPVLLLYALNTLLCTWHSLARLVRSGARAPSAYGPTVMHLGFLVALAAHGVGGALGGEDRAVVVGPEVTDMGGGWSGQLLDLHVERLPGGMPKQVHARLLLRGPGGEVSDQEVGFNRPASVELGSRLWLLTRFDPTRTMVLLRARRAPGNPVALGAVIIFSLGMVMMGRRWFS